MARDVLDRTGERLDVLVNNASNFYPTPLGTVTEEQWDDLVGSNLKAPLFLAQALLPALREARGVDREHRGCACPAAVARSSGLRSRQGRPCDADALPRQGPRSRNPGERRFAGRDPWPDEGMSDPLRAAIIKQTALKRSGEPEDIAAAVLFLVRDAPYVTGQIIAVDGGRSVGW